MCVKLSELRSVVCAYAAAFDPALVTGEHADAVMSEAAAIESAAAALKAMAAARVSETSQWRGGSDRSAADYLARRTGTTSTAAADAIQTAERLKALPEASAAARRGELSPQQASAIAIGATADPTAETRLVAQAKRASLQELREEAARVRAASANEDAEARRARIHRQRYLRTWTDAGGSWNLAYRNNPEAGARMMAVINTMRDKIFRQARAEGRRESPEAYGADALDVVVSLFGAEAAKRRAETAASKAAAGGGGAAATATGPPPAPPAPGNPAPTADTGPATAATTLPGIAGADDTDVGVPLGPPVPTSDTWGGASLKAIIRIDFAALWNGVVEGEEVCEIAGYGPIAVSAVREMLASGNPFVAAVITRGKQVVGVAHLGRNPTALQQTALEWRDPTCAAEGCSAVARLERDHRDDWSKTFRTSFESLDRLCPPMHKLKTNEGWALVEGTGKRPFVPPTDPRHPRNAATKGAAANPSPANPSPAPRPPPPAANDPPQAA